MTLIIDSYAWIEFLTAGPLGPTVRKHLETQELLITPDLVLAEVARKFGREAQSVDLIRGHLRTVASLSDVVPVTIEVALETTGADAELRSHAQKRKLNSPSFADVIILACARALDAEVLTADVHFRGLQRVVWIGS